MPETGDQMFPHSQVHMVSAIPGWLSNFSLKVFLKNFRAYPPQLPPEKKHPSSSCKDLHPSPQTAPCGRQPQARLSPPGVTHWASPLSPLSSGSALPSPPANPINLHPPSQTVLSSKLPAQRGTGAPPEVWGHCLESALRPDPGQEG